MCSPSCNRMCLVPGGRLACWQWDTDILLARPRGGDLKSMKVKGRLISFCPLWLQGVSAVQGRSYRVVKKKLLLPSEFLVHVLRVTVTCTGNMRSTSLGDTKWEGNTSTDIWISPPSWMVHDFNPTNLWYSLQWNAFTRHRIQICVGKREFFSVYQRVFGVHQCWIKDRRSLNCKRTWRSSNFWKL